MLRQYRVNKEGECYVEVKGVLTLSKANVKNVLITGCIPVVKIMLIHGSLIRNILININLTWSWSWININLT